MRTIPVYLTLCALLFAAWHALAPGPSPSPAFGWTLAGMIALYAVSAVILRAHRPEQPVTHAIDEAARVNAARLAAPPGAPSGPTR